MDEKPGVTPMLGWVQVWLPTIWPSRTSRSPSPGGTRQSTFSRRIRIRRARRLRAVVALAGLAHREGAVIRTPRGEPFVSHDRQGGGQIKTAWKTSLRRAELDPQLAPHDLRHTWASWHYAINRDPMLLRAEGQWSSIALVERYAHLMKSGYEHEIRAFWGIADISAAEVRA